MLHMISLPPRRRVFRPGDCLERLDQRLQYVSEFLEELPDDVIVQKLVLDFDDVMDLYCNARKSYTSLEKCLLVQAKSGRVQSFAVFVPGKAEAVLWRKTLQRHFPKLFRKNLLHILHEEVGESLQIILVRSKT